MHKKRKERVKRQSKDISNRAVIILLLLLIIVSITGIILYLSALETTETFNSGKLEGYPNSQVESPAKSVPKNVGGKVTFSIVSPESSSKPSEGVQV